MKRLFAILPCYNEQEDITPLVEKWISHAEEFLDKGYTLSVHCVDDKSTDSTNEVIRTLVSRYPEQVYLIEHEINKGLGGALQTAFEYFHNNGTLGDICVLMDGDNTHDPVYTMDMLPKLELDCDCVIASRYCTSSEVKGVSSFRVFLSDGARFYYSAVLGVKNVKDYTCGYRGYTYEIIDKGVQQYGEKLVERRSFACMMEALYKLSRIGARFGEVPFELRYDNKQGESKMRILKTIKDSLLTAFQLRFSRHK